MQTEVRLCLKGLNLLKKAMNTVQSALHRFYKFLFFHTTKASKANFSDDTASLFFSKEINEVFLGNLACNQFSSIIIKKND